MILTFTYEHAVLLQRLVPSENFPDELCSDYTCCDCPVGAKENNCDLCPFSLAYLGGYSEASIFTRRDMRAQFPPEAYPELYI